MTGLYDLHTHTILSDGEMLPTELVRRMAVIGYSTVAITDHVDTSNATPVVTTLLEVQESARFLASDFCAVSRSLMYLHLKSPQSPGKPGSWSRNHRCSRRDDR